ncbi:MAG: sugar phosphate isomerase/epimerase family protein [Pseudolysinimonas sp.]
MPFPLCLNSNTYHGFALADAIEGAARSGLRLIELSAVAGYTEHVMPDLDDAGVHAVLASLRERGIRAVALGGHSNLTTEEGRARFRANLHLGHRLGVEYVVTGTGETHGDESHIDDEQDFAGQTRELAGEAHSLGLRIAIETHGANYATGDAVGRLVERIASPAVGIAYDTGNTIFYGDTAPYDDLARALPNVVGIHLKDKAGAATDWDFPAIGDGDTDFAHVLDLLRAGDTGAVVPLSIEIEFTPDGPADVEEVHLAVARSVAHLHSLGYDRLPA